MNETVILAYFAQNLERAYLAKLTELMETELNDLLDEQEQLGTLTAENSQKLTDKANEYLIWALATAVDFKLTDRFERTKNYFSLSLKADRNPENLFAYSNFLQKHSQFEEAIPVCKETLLLYRELAQADPQAYLPSVARTLNNLGVLSERLNALDQTRTYYELSLQIRRQLAQVNPQTHLPDVATTVVNMSLFFKNYIHNKPRSLIYAEETLRAALPFANSLPVMGKCVRTVLVTVATWGENPMEFFQRILSEITGQDE